MAKEKENAETEKEKVIIVDFSGHIDPSNDYQIETDGKEVKTVKVLQAKTAGMFINFDEDVSEQVSEFVKDVQETLREAFQRALEKGADAVVVIPHGMSSLMTVIQLSGFPVRGVDLLVAFWDSENERYIAIEPRRVRVMPK